MGSGGERTTDGTNGGTVQGDASGEQRPVDRNPPDGASETAETGTETVSPESETMGDGLRRRLLAVVGMAVVVLSLVAYLSSVSTALGVFFLAVSAALAVANRRGSVREERLGLLYAMLFLAVSLHYFGIMELI